MKKPTNGAGESPAPKPFHNPALLKAIRYTDRYDEWRRQVFLRDRFTCQQCGARNGRKRVIEAHHLNPLYRLVQEYQITSVAQAKATPALWVVENGQTLCKTCHEQTESYSPKHKTDGKANSIK